MIETFSAAAFKPHIESRFTAQVRGAARGVLLQLIEVAQPPGAIGERTFSLVFRAAPGASLPQGMHDLAHPQLGAFALFVVPIGPAPGDSQARLRYEAVVNRGP